MRSQLTRRGTCRTRRCAIPLQYRNCATQYRVRNRVDSRVILCRFQQMRQLRCRRARQRPSDIAARQSLQRCRGRLDAALHIAAGSVRHHHVFVCLGISQFRQIILALFLCRVCGECCAGFFLGRLQPVQVTLRPGNIRHLATNVADHPNRVQAVLLFLLVEDRADAVVSMFGVATQFGHVLLLVCLVADSEGALCHGGLRGAFLMAFITRSGDHATRQVALEFIPEAAAAAQADTGVRGFKVRFVVDIAEAERSGIEAVFVRRGGGRDNRAIKLGVMPHGDVEAAIPGIQPGLFGHRIKAALHLVLAGVDIA